MPSLDRGWQGATGRSAAEIPPGTLDARIFFTRGSTFDHARFPPWRALAGGLRTCVAEAFLDRTDVEDHARPGHLWPHDRDPVADLLAEKGVRQGGVH